MEDTSCGKNCPFVKQGFCENEQECPNYLESWWIKGKEQEHKLVKDCSPKRMLIQQNYLQSRLDSVQESLDISRNRYIDLECQLKSVLIACQTLIKSNCEILPDQNQELKQIE